MLPPSRTGSNGGSLDAVGSDSTEEARSVGGSARPAGLDKRFAPHAAVATNDAPLIGERAATRERIATEDGDDHAGLKWACQFEPSLANRIGRREPRRAGGHSTD